MSDSHLTIHGAHSEADTSHEQGSTAVLVVLFLCECHIVATKQFIQMRDSSARRIMPADVVRNDGMIGTFSGIEHHNILAITGLHLAKAYVFTIQ